MATGILRFEFIPHRRRHLAALGFEIAGNVEPRTTLPTAPAAPAAAAAGPAATGLELEEWHTEANVQAALVTALAAEGWRIHSVANTATKEHGIDVIASYDGRTVGVEVKGFPAATTQTRRAPARPSAPARAPRPAIGTPKLCWPRGGCAGRSRRGAASSPLPDFATATCTPRRPARRRGADRGLR